MSLAQNRRAKRPQWVVRRNRFPAAQPIFRHRKVRAIGASNHDVPKLKEAFALAVDKALPRHETLRPRYNLYSRDTFGGEFQDFAVAENLGLIVFFSLESGFPSGK